MHYSVIKPLSIENGPGCRVSLFVSGCRNHCPHCFQQETWDFGYGQEFTEETEKEIIELMKPTWVKGITLLGGEPFEPENQPALLHLTNRIRAELPEKTIWAYSGCTYEQLHTPGFRGCTDVTEALLDNIDVLVDGPFIEARKNLLLPFRGSDNQRLIDLKKTKGTGAIILVPDRR